MASRSPSPPPRPPPLPLTVLALVLLTSPASGCVSTVLQHGTLPDSELLVPELALTSSCSCCALCYQLPGCASLSFSKSACRLYRSVPDFQRLQLDTESAMFVRPGRSGHHQFCRFDSDCLEASDRCHGRLCTTDPTVTCRDLAETYGGPHQGYFYGSINGTTMKIYCRVAEGLAGWTMIGYYRRGYQGWDRFNILERDVGVVSSSYSILGLTDVLRLSGSEPRYRIRILGKSSVGYYRGFIGSLPTSQSLIVRSATEAVQADLVVEGQVNNYVTESDAAGHFRLPWLPDSGHSLLSIGKPQADNVLHRAIVNTMSAPYLDDNPYEYIQYLMRE